MRFIEENESAIQDLLYFLSHPFEQDESDSKHDDALPSESHFTTHIEQHKSFMKRLQNALHSKKFKLGSKNIAQFGIQVDLFWAVVCEKYFVCVRV